jgi:hypothetical protein
MHLFDQDILFEPQEADSFKGRITENWSINGVPDGGYLMAILAKAMLHQSEMNSTPTITANYLNRCEPGAAAVTIERMSASRQFQRFQACLHQSGTEKIRAFGTFVSEKVECILESYEVADPRMADLQQCFQLPALPNYTLFNQLDIRLDPTCTGWMSGKLSDRSEIKGWIKFKEERPFDGLSIILIADSFPPAVMASQGMVAWVPTIELTVNIRNIPTTRWLKCRFRTRFITCGLLEEDGEVWDESGQLIAISRQIAQYRTHAK